MTISTYAGLQSAVTDWLQDSALASSAPTFIALAEAEFNRLLRVPAMEAVSNGTLNGESLLLPGDFLAIKSVTLLTNPQAALEGSTLSTLKLLHGGTSGVPTAYAVTDDQLWFGPVPDGAYDVQISYWQRIPSLSVSEPTNWLLTRHPDLYLMASLAQAELYGWNDGRLSLIKGRADEIMAQILDEGRRQGTPARLVLSHGVRGG